MKVLHLTLKKKFFDQILSGIKKQEYREIKPYWIVRLLSNIEYLTDLEGVKNVEARFKSYDAIKFTNGYASDSPTFTIECKGISIGKAVPEWSNNWQGEVFIIHLGNIIS